MGKQCEICGKKAQVGNLVSHSNIKTKRRFNPNLPRVRHQFADAIRKLMQDIAYKLRIQMTACQHAEEMLRML